MKNRRRLTNEVQVFIVQSLARYMMPTEIVEAVKEEFGVEVTRQLIRNYSPERSAAGGKWQRVFDEARAKFLEGLQSIGISHRAYRLAELQRLYHAAGRNIALKSALLEQAAKECGGMFTNRREITGQGGAPIRVDTRQVNRKEWAETQLAEFMEEFKLDRGAAIAGLKKTAPLVLEYLGEVG